MIPNPKITHTTTYNVLTDFTPGDPKDNKLVHDSILDELKKLFA